MMSCDPPLPPDEINNPNTVIQTSVVKKLKSVKQAEFWDVVSEPVSLGVDPEAVLVAGIKNGEIIGLNEVKVASVVSNGEYTTIVFELPIQWALRHGCKQLAEILRQYTQPLVQLSQPSNQTQPTQGRWFSFDSSLIESCMDKGYLKLLQGFDKSLPNDGKKS
jgi:hypothetical protein